MKQVEERAGNVEAIHTSKSRPDAESGMCMLDVERGVVDRIRPRAWQTGIGNRHADTRALYKTFTVQVQPPRSSPCR
jgi:hypothetical protein